MDWKGVGAWIKGNAGTGAALVGSLLIGDVPRAVAAGVALVSSATGSDDPAQVLQQLQTDPATLVRLKELAYENEQSIRAHIEVMTCAELEDRQAEHHETQETIRNGDNSDDVVVRRTRPFHATVALFAGVVYAYQPDPSFEILAILLALPFGYAGFRQIGKGITSISEAMVLRSKAGK